jgi:hypothetical protein
MGVVTMKAAIKTDPISFVKDFKTKLATDPAGSGLIDSKFLQDSDDEQNVFIQLTWTDIATAKKNFVAVQQMLQDRGVATLRGDAEIMSNVGP